MARVATISKNDVYLARDELRTEGLPHGISAIRKRLGRGSPGLISQHLRALDDQPDRPLPAEALDEIVNQLIDALHTQGLIPTSPTAEQRPLSETVPRINTVDGHPRLLEEANKTIAEQRSHIDQLQRDVMTLERQLGNEQAQSAASVATIASLENELELQRNTFESWRRDHVRDRAMLAARIELLGNALEPAKPNKTPTMAPVSRGTQLDLYGQPVDD